MQRPGMPSAQWGPQPGARNKGGRGVRPDRNHPGRWKEQGQSPPRSEPSVVMSLGRMDPTPARSLCHDIPQQDTACPGWTPLL